MEGRMRVKNLQGDDGEMKRTERDGVRRERERESDKARRGRHRKRNTKGHDGPKGGG
jgi:hypothetical protein